MIEIDTTKEHINIVRQHASLISMPYKKTKPTAFQTTVRLSTCSQLRSDILINLRDGKKELRDFRTELGVSSTTAIHALRDLGKDNLVFQDEDRNYALTKIGEVIALKLADFIDAIEVMKTHEKFWLTHDLSGIPEHLIDKIGWLKDSSVIRINALDIIKTHKAYAEVISGAKWVKGIAPIFSSDYPSMFEGLIKNDIDTSLILTKNVFEKVTKCVDIEDIESHISGSHLKIFITEEDIKVAFTVGDAFFSLGLFTLDGIYDITCDLVSTDIKSICWGKELFEYYLKEARRL